MKKSELKRHIKEALTPDEASKVDSKYKEIYSGMLKNNPLKLKKYDNPDAVAYGRAIKLIQKESAKMLEKKLTAAEKDKKEDIIMSLKKQKGGKDKLKPADYAIATSQAKKLAEDGEEIAKKNMDMYKDKNRLTELIKAALMGPMNEKKQRPDYPDIDGDGDTEEPMVKAAKDKEKDLKIVSKSKKKTFESVNEGKKRFKRQDGIGKAKYTISFHDGRKKHKDGSDFFDIKIFKNKKDLSNFVGTLVKKGYKPTNESVNEDAPCWDTHKQVGTKMKGAGKGPTAKQKKRMAETILKELKGNVNENKSAVHSLGKDLYNYMTNVAKMKGSLSSPIKTDTINKGQQFTVLINDNGGKFDSVKLFIPVGEDNINKEYIQKNIVDQVKRKYKELETKITQSNQTGNNKAIVNFTLTGPNLFQKVTETILKELRG